MEDYVHSIKDVQQLFYNMLLEETLEAKKAGIKIDFDNPEFIKFIIKKVLYIIFINYDNIKSYDGIAYRADNVPREYKEIFNMLEHMHMTQKNYHIDDRTQFLNECFNKIMTEIQKFYTFEPMIKKMKIFYDDMHKEHVPTVEMIRETFYNMMVENTILSGYFPKDDLISREPYIFFGLTAHTILDTVIRSKGYPGIKLLDDSIVTDTLCPGEFKELCGVIFKIKALIDTRIITQNQLQYIKNKILQNDDIPEYTDITPEQINEIKDIISIFIDISIDITRNIHFKNIIDDVLKFCINAM